MYNSISFATFHIHTGHDVDSNTLSKTIAIYQTHVYVHSENNALLTSKEIKNEVRKKSNLIKGIDFELYPYFTWHLN